MRQPATNQRAIPIHITMFGTFSISAGNKQIKDSVARTHQLWHLIEYLITFRHRAIAQEELIDVLWPEGNIDNPSNALKNLVYRVRSTLNAHGLPYAKEMIVYSRGSYRWNNDLNCTVDIEMFDELYKQAFSSTKSPEQQIDRLLLTIDLYQGDFLMGARFESWVIPIAGQYRTQYFECVYAVLELLEERNRYDEIEAICRRAIEIDPFAERVHRFLIGALIHEGRQADAMAHYSAVTDLFFRDLGVSPSAPMRELYREIAKTVHDVEIDLSIIKEDLEESERRQGAFYCEYEVFKNLYRIEARSAARSGQSIFISLITVESADGRRLDVKVQNKMMDSLYEIVQSSFRQGDVYARFSASQYVLLLPALSYKSCEMVMERVAKRFRNTHRNRNIVISYKIQPLDPIDLDKHLF